MKDERVHCTICEREWEAIPPDASQVGRQLYRFSDGSVHRLVLSRLGFQKGVKHPPRKLAAQPQKEKK